MGVVVLGKEAPGAQDNHTGSSGRGVEAAQALRRQLGHAIDVAGRQRPCRFVEEDGFLPRLVPDRLTDHQGGGGGEDEPLDACGAGGLQQVQRPGDIHVDEGLLGIAGDVGLVQRARVDDAVDGVVGEHAGHRVPVGDGGADGGFRAGGGIQADGLVSRAAQVRAQRPPQPAGRSGDKDPHHPTAASGAGRSRPRPLQRRERSRRASAARPRRRRRSPATSPDPSAAER